MVNVLYEYRIELAAAFEKFDLDHSGSVSLDEFRVGLQALTGAVGSPLTDMQAEELMKALDKDSDGRLSYEEFLSGFRLVDEGGTEDTSDSPGAASGAASGAGAGAGGGSGASLSRRASGSSLTLKPDTSIGVKGRR